MGFLGNLVWLIFGGLIAGLGYIIAGLALCLTIIGIPFGLMTIRIGFATFAPFGKEVVALPRANSPLRILFNVLWIVLFGWELTIGHLFWGILLTLTIIGIPFGKQHFKLIPLALMPFGRDLQPERGR